MPTAFSLQKNDDGSFTIPGVPIFKMGKHRGTNYDQQWFDDWVKNFNADKAQGWRPPVFIGHHGFFDDSEKSVLAEIDNPRIEDDAFVVDYLISSSGALKVFKSGLYPHRSVEVDPQERVIYGVAQLGGNQPYHKMPPLRFQRMNEDSLSVIVNNDDFSVNVPDEFIADNPVAPSSAAAGSPAPSSAEVGVPARPESNVAPDGSPRFAALPPAAGGTKGESDDPAAAQFQAERAQFQAEKRAFRLQQIDTQFKKLQEAGLAVPLLNQFRALRESFLERPDLQTIKFSTDGAAPAELPVDKFLDNLLADLTNRIHAQTFAAPTQPAKTGINPNPAQLFDSGNDNRLNAELDKRAKDLLRSRGITQWSHDQYSAALREIQSA